MRSLKSDRTCSYIRSEVMCVRVQVGDEVPSAYAGAALRKVVRLRYSTSVRFELLVWL